MGQNWFQISVRPVKEYLPKGTQGLVSHTQHRTLHAAKEIALFTFKSSAASRRRQFGLQKLVLGILAPHTFPALPEASRHEEVASGPANITERCGMLFSSPDPLSISSA